MWCVRFMQRNQEYNERGSSRRVDFAKSGFDSFTVVSFDVVTIKSRANVSFTVDTIFNLREIMRIT